MALRLAIRAELQPWTEYFEGSFSIKYVLEPLVPELSYNDLVIVDGLVVTRPVDHGGEQQHLGALGPTERHSRKLPDMNS